MHEKNVRDIIKEAEVKYVNKMYNTIRVFTLCLRSRTSFKTGINAFTRSGLYVRGCRGLIRGVIMCDYGKVGLSVGVHTRGAYTWSSRYVREKVGLSLGGGGL